MAWRTLGTLGLAVIVVAAGCSGLVPVPGDPTPTSRPLYDVPETTAQTAKTWDSSNSPASPAFLAATANHTSALNTIGGFVIRERLYTNTNQSPFRQSFAANLSADRYWWGIPSAPDDGVYDEGAFYQTGSMVYGRQESSNATPRYRRVSPPPALTPRKFTLQLVHTVPNASVFFPFERNGTATFDGEEMARFTASEPSLFGCSGMTGGPDRLQNVTGFRATALVDDRGIIRRFECILEGYRYTGEFHSERLVRTITEVGTATISPPEGLATDLSTTQRGGYRETVIFDALVSMSPLNDAGHGVSWGWGVVDPGWSTIAPERSLRRGR